MASITKPEFERMVRASEAFLKQRRDYSAQIQQRDVELLQAAENEELLNDQLAQVQVSLRGELTKNQRLSEELTALRYRFFSIKGLFEALSLQKGDANNKIAELTRQLEDSNQQLASLKFLHETEVRRLQQKNYVLQLMAEIANINKDIALYRTDQIAMVWPITAVGAGVGGPAGAVAANLTMEAAYYCLKNIGTLFTGRDGELSALWKQQKELQTKIDEARQVLDVE